MTLYEPVIYSAVVVHQLPTKTSFAKLENGEEVFISSRVAKAASLSVNDVIRVTCIPNAEPATDAKWFALRAEVHDPATKGISEQIMALLADGPLSTEQVAEAVGDENVLVESALQFQHAAGRIARAAIYKQADHSHPAFNLWALEPEDFLYEEEGEA